MTETHQPSEGEPDRPREATTAATETLSTGIDVLDRKLDGGIPAGRMMALLASPGSQSELFLYEMAGARKTVYLTTERRKTDVETELEQTEQSSREVAVHRLEASDPISDARAVIEDLPGGSMLIVDPVDPLEAMGEERYRTFLNDIKRRTVETGSLTLLHCLDGHGVSAQRGKTKYHVDVIFDLVTKLRGGSIENRLSVPKFRGGHSLPDAIDLDLTSDVTVDVSRKIA